MTRVGRNALRAPWLAVVALVVAGCGISVFGRGDPGPVPDQPMADNALPPVIKIADGVGPRGQYRAWVYRTKDGMTCLDVMEAGGGSGSCGPNADAIVGLSIMGDAANGITATGGTREVSARAVVTTLQGGATVQNALMRPGAFLPGDLGLFVVMLPKGAAIDRIEIVDANGLVLQTLTP